MNACTGGSSRPPATRHGHRRTLPLHLQQRNALVEAHRHLVPPLAGHYGLRCREPREDLTQVGFLGLIRAAELYRHNMQTPFAAFARPHIRGAILHHLRDGAAMVRLPRRQSELRARLARLEDAEPLAAGGRSAATTACWRQLGVTPEQWRLLCRHKQLCRPAPLEGALLEQVASPADDPLEADAASLRLEDLLTGLDPRSQNVVRWVVVQGWSYRKAAAALDVSAMTVQRCLRKGLATLREQLREGESPKAAGTRPLTPGRRVGRAPSAAQGWPSRHSPPPAGAPVRLSRP
ncbi:MAG: hypothetical protein RLZZ117_68 [Cyanobacteriota bacterium]